MSQTITLTMDAGRTYTYVDSAGQSHTEQRTMEVFVNYPSSGPGNYPVVFYSAGNHANAEATGGLNARLLADKGYIVIVPRHLDDYAMPDAIEDYFDRSNPQSAVERVKDMNFLADNASTILSSLPSGYTGDLSTPVVAGQSLGAFTAQMLVGVQSAFPEYANLANPFFEAAILISPQGVVPDDLNKPASQLIHTDDTWSGLYYENAQSNSWTSVTVPTLTITGEDDGGDGGMSYLERRDPFDYGIRANSHAAVIDGADHFELGGFNSLGFVTETYVNWATRDVSDTFLQAYVKGNASALAQLDDAAAYRASHVYNNTTAFMEILSGRADGLLVGTGSADTLTGSWSVDLLQGAGGADVLYGMDGNDTLQGGTGADDLYGGLGDDRFVFAVGDSGTLASTRDQILDFDDFGDDIVDLTAFGGLVWRGTSAFSGAGQVRVVTSGSHVLVQVNTDTDSSAEFVLELTNTTMSQVSASDFLL